MIGIGIYVKNSPRAAKLYSAAFGLELGYHVLNEDGTFFHSELTRNGEPFISVVEATADTFTERNPVELGVTFDSQEELENAFSVLKEGGKVKLDICELPWNPCAAIVTDSFGVNWFLSLPQHRPSDDWTP